MGYLKEKAAFISLSTVIAVCKNFKIMSSQISMVLPILDPMRIDLSPVSNSAPYFLSWHQFPFTAVRPSLKST